MTDGDRKEAREEDKEEQKVGEKQKMEAGNKNSALNLPNLLSLIRIGFVPLLILFFWLGSNQHLQDWNLWAALLFVVGIATDPLDGWIARKKDLITDIGKLLDPLADKLLVISSLILMVQAGWVAAWIVIVIVSRALAVTGLRGIASSQGVVIHASGWGKLKTWSQASAVTLLLIDNSFSFLTLTAGQLGTYVLYLAVVLTVISGANYFYQFYKRR